MKNVIVLFLFIGTITSTSFFVEKPLFENKGIHDQWDYLLKKYVDEHGSVNYKKWSKNKVSLNNYIKLLEQRPPEPYWDHNDSLAYFINAYNAITVKLILDNYPLESIRDLKKPWDNTSLNLLSEKLTLNDIEHKILRKMKDPRIHFAINCASESCPNLLNEAYLASKVQNQLEEVTYSFINDFSKNSFSENELILSRIFLWFSKDFGSKKERVAFVKKYANEKFSENAKIKYSEYSWKLNE
jgi:hypothetical protein